LTIISHDPHQNIDMYDCSEYEIIDTTYIVVSNATETISCVSNFYNKLYDDLNNVLETKIKTKKEKMINKHKLNLASYVYSLYLKN